MTQKRQNIAGTYRGLTTECLSLVRSTDCRTGLAEVIKLADEVDARRVEWEQAVAGGGPSATKMQDDYTQAVSRLNLAVTDFNRNMSAAAESKP